MNKSNTLIKLSLAAVVSSILLSCSTRSSYKAFGGFAQGGTYTVKVNFADVKISPDEVASSIDSILTLVDTTLSGYNSLSQLSRLNRGERIRPNQLLMDIYAYSHEMYGRTGGALDVSSAPLFDIWGFGFTTDSLPEQARVDEALAACGMDRLADDMHRVLSEDGTLCASDLLKAAGTAPKLNFNAIAQGWTCDMVASYLHSIGVKDMLVDIGEIYCEGLNPAGRPWTLGVDRPVDGNETPGADLDGIWRSDGGAYGVVTSGNYRKFYIRDGHKYAHTIDPRTGFPVSHNLLSATVVAPTAADADAYATYCMVIGLDAAREFIEGDPNLQGYLIYDADGGMKVWSSSDFFIENPE
jgi:FAD:protein FMN transferase